LRRMHEWRKQGQLLSILPLKFCFSYFFYFINFLSWYRDLFCYFTIKTTKKVISRHFVRQPAMGSALLIFYPRPIIQ